jgi:prepilin-type N-terminal cleavage/methylation domain-containing protein
MTGVQTCKRDNVITGGRGPRRAGFHVFTFSRFHVFTFSRFHVFTFSRFHAFTLIEMLVSLAVISLALAVVGIVFSITVKTAGQSAAYSETHNWVRQFMQQIDEDLRYCVPSQSILVLVGRTQAAALTKSDLDAGKFYRVLIGNPANVPAGYDPEFNANLDNPNPLLAQYSDPRADLLMFFSNRPTVSVAPALNPSATDPYAAGVKFAPILVTYGQAGLGQPQWDGTNYQFPPDTSLRHIDNVGGLSLIPANRWHLGRRATIVGRSGNATWDLDFDGEADDGVDERGRITAGRATRNYPGDVATFDLPAFLTDPALLNAGLAPRSPYVFDTDATAWPLLLKQRILRLLYRDGENDQFHHVATVLEDVPVELKSNLGVHMLPGCVWFQVEFLMPEDPRNSVEYSDPTPLILNDYSSRSDMPRWTTVQDGFTYVFVPDTAENREALARPTPGSGSRLDTFALLNPTGANTVANRVIRLWPYAIRITVRVWDAQKRLDEPIVRSIVHRFE